MSPLYAGKKFLIIENTRNYAQILTQILNELGAKSVDTCLVARDAMNILNQIHYDVILCEFQLTTRVQNAARITGQHILNSIKQEFSPNQSSIFIMMTSEPYLDLLSEEESANPNIYLIKPISVALIKKVIDSAFADRMVFGKIYDAAQQHRFDDAFAQLNNLSDKYPKLRAKIQLTFADMHLLAEHYDKSAHAYHDILNQRYDIYAALGFGKCAYYQGNYSLADSTFSSLITTTKHFIRAYDWDAKALIAMNESERALKVLQKAVSYAPHSYKRQLHLARLAAKHKLLEEASRGYRQAISIGTGDEQNVVEIILEFIRFVTVNLYIFRSNTNYARVKDTCLSYLARVEEESRREIDKLFLAKLVEFEFYKALDEYVKSNDIFRHIQIMYHDYKVELSYPTLIEYALLLEKIKRIEEARLIVQNLGELSDYDAVMLKPVAHLIIESPLTIQARQLQSTGAHLEAFQLLSTAVKQFPTSVAINFDLLKIGLQLLKQKKGNQTIIRCLSDAITHLKSQALTYEDSKLYKKYVDLYRHLVKPK